MTQEVLEMTTKFMTDPIRILAKRDELTYQASVCIMPPLSSPVLTSALQFFVSVEQEDWKFDTLCDLYVVSLPPCGACV